MEWFVQMTMGLKFIHGKRILHRDLKTQNVFLTKTDIIKIGDFGISRVLEDTVDMASTCVGTPCYLSPEICQDKPYNSKSDIWSLGCLLYELCALRPAFNATNLVSLCYKIVKGDYEPIPDMYSNLVRMLIEKSLQKNPESRPSATGILNLPEVREQLSAYINEKETERKSVQPNDKKGTPESKISKVKKKAVRPNVVNIGGEPKKKVKKSKKPSNQNKAVTKKRKKKTKVDQQDIHDVENLPSTPVMKEEGKISEAPMADVPSSPTKDVQASYSPPTFSRCGAAAKPKSYAASSRENFMNDYATVAVPKTTNLAGSNEAADSLEKNISPVSEDSSNVEEPRSFEINNESPVKLEKEDTLTILYRVPKLPVKQTPNIKTESTDCTEFDSGIASQGPESLTILEDPQQHSTVKISDSIEDLQTPVMEEELTLLPGQMNVHWSVEPSSTGSFVPQKSSSVYSTKQFIPHLYDDDEIPEEILIEVSNDENEDVSGEPGDVYSDDFEEDVSADEDNIDCLPNYQDINEIPEMDEWFDDDEEEEDNDVFEMAMRSARVALDNIEEEDEESFVEDYVLPQHTGNIAALRQHCIDMLGEDLFEKVKSVCKDFEDNYDSHQTFQKKLEELAGKDLLEICLMVDEFFIHE